MVCMLIEASNLFGCQPAAKGEDEVVERQLSFNFTMRNRHFSLEWIDMSNFGFDEVHSSIDQGVTKVERNVFRVAPAESQSHQCRVKNKLSAAGNQGDLVFVTKLFARTLGGSHAAKSTTKNQNLRLL